MKYRPVANSVRKKAQEGQRFCGGASEQRHCADGGTEI